MDPPPTTAASIMSPANVSASAAAANLGDPDPLNGDPAAVSLLLSSTTGGPSIPPSQVVLPQQATSNPTTTTTSGTNTTTSPQQQPSVVAAAQNVNGSTTLEQFVKAFNSTAEDGERIIEVSPNGRYAKLNVVLGKGAYKVVYKAIDREEGYEVAWNCFQTSRQEFNELSQEIEILKRVRHPNIINFHDCWYNNVEFIFITELMTSGTLREYIRKLQQPNMKIVKRWCRQILKGLLYLHSHDPPIIHRDIKCDNIFINGAHGEVKIGDMGTAKMKLGRKYTVIGTPEFMAPEMYEEKGYSEKVDVYAFGMCLLEMVTGEYPYSECTNAAQIYKKVTQGIKPDCVSRVQDTEVIDLINKCLCDEAERWSVSEVLDHIFLTVEPEVVLLSFNENKTHLALQVVFKGTDRMSVKFEFNINTDTAEQVVSEMIEENVLPQKYQQLITLEINRTLRDLNKISNDDPRKEDSQEAWRSQESYKDELEKAKVQVKMANDRAQEAEKKAELSEVRARLAEEKSKTNANSSPVTSTQQLPPSNVEPQIVSPPPELATPLVPGSQQQQNDDVPVASTQLKDYRDEQAIEDLVKDTALVNNRGLEKATEWLQRLKTQDIMTVGDLRDLHDEDWSSLGLTVFAGRALRNALHGKSVRNISPKTISVSVSGTPLTTGAGLNSSDAGPGLGLGLAMTSSGNDGNGNPQSPQMQPQNYHLFSPNLQEDTTIRQSTSGQPPPPHDRPLSKNPSST